MDSKISKIQLLSVLVTANTRLIFSMLRDWEKGMRLNIFDLFILYNEFALLSESSSEAKMRTRSGNRSR